jgi:hypothetical protein
MQQDSSQILPFLATCYWKAFRMWIDYWILCGAPLGPDTFLVRIIAKWVKCIKEIDMAKTMK